MLHAVVLLCHIRGFDVPLKRPVKCLAGTFVDGTQWGLVCLQPDASSANPTLQCEADFNGGKQTCCFSYNVSYWELVGISVKFGHMFGLNGQYDSITREDFGRLQQRRDSFLSSLLFVPRPKDLPWRFPQSFGFSTGAPSGCIQASRSLPSQSCATDQLRNHGKLQPIAVSRCL